MSTNRLASDQRRHRATESLEALGGRRADAEVLSVQCAHAHHLASVYDTDAGLVVVAHTGGHAHGSKDFVDTVHHGGGRPELVDLLALPGMGSDELRAWCDCGWHTLSRTALVAEVRAGRRTVRVG